MAAVAGITLSLASVHTDAGDYEHSGAHPVATLPEDRRMPGNHRATGWGWLQLGDIHAGCERPATPRAPTPRRGDSSPATARSTACASLTRASARALQTAE